MRYSPSVAPEHAGPPQGRNRSVSARSCSAGAAAAPARWRRGRSEAGWLALALGTFAVVWLWHLAATSLAPPVDDVEQLVWVQTLAWGYTKHPPLPTWLIWPAVQLFGPRYAVAALLGAATTLGAMALFWALLRRLRGSADAWLALGAVLCISYYNGRLDYYNHEVVLLLASNACAVFAWQAHRTRRLRWWLALGLGLGLGALAKYQIVVTATAAAMFFVLRGDAALPAQRRGALLAATVALLVFLPHLAWLAGNGFAPVHYAMESSLGAGLGLATRVKDAAHWLLDQSLNRGLPALVFLGVCSRLRRPSEAAAPVRHDAARTLLLAWGLTPLAFMPLTGLLAGADLQLHWGMPFLPWAVAAGMELLRPAGGWRSVRPRAAATLFVAVQALLLLVSWATSPVGVPAWRQPHWRSFDAALLAERIGPPARQALGGPVQRVIGPAPWAGTLALALPEHPAVQLESRLAQRLAGADGRARACGALHIAPIGRLPGGEPLGPPFEGLAWRVEPPAPGAAGGCGVD